MRLILIGAAALALAVPELVQRADEPLVARAVRFYGAGDATTTIEVLAEVRPAALRRGMTPQDNGAGRYRVDVTVQDSAGLVLQRSDWVRDYPAGVGSNRRATVVESFSIGAAAGLYRINVQVSSPQGDTVRQQLDVRAFGSRPALSDLLLATEARRAADSAGAGPGVVRRGGYLLRTAPTPRLTPMEAALNWYVEIYPRGAATSGEMSAEVVGENDRVIVRTPARAVTIGAEGAATPGSMDLAGLAEGSYRLRLRVRLGDSTLSAEAPFEMAAMSAVASAPGEASDMFTDADEARLDSLFAPLVYIAQGNETRVYQRLTLEGKRRFLREFWQRRDLTPGTAANEARDEFYRAVAFVNSEFGEHGRGQIPGWNTDRGRIYLKNGRWDEMLERPMATVPYIAWKYTRGQQRFYVFYDQTGLGHYALIGTNDRTERSNPWQRTLGREASQDIYRFLGRDFTELNADPD